MTADGEIVWLRSRLDAVFDLCDKRTTVSTHEIRAALDGRGSPASTKEPLSDTERALLALLTPHHPECLCLRLQLHGEALRALQRRA